MVIIKILGGLGNQMFQYAAGFALSQHLNQPIKLDLRGLYAGEDVRSIYELDVFGIPPEQAENRELSNFFRKTRLGSKLLQDFWLMFNSYKLIKDPNKGFMKDLFTQAKSNTYIKGLFHSELYFLNYREELLSVFTFIKPLDPLNKKIVELINSTDSISVHIRRGDYISIPYFQQNVGTLKLEYYYKAIADLISKLPEKKNFHFFVFSDDQEWVQENFKVDYPITFVSHNTGKESYRDMQLMSLCKYNIIANSTFSWWAAWLNNNKEKIVYAPKQWIAKPSEAHHTIDKIPTSWNLI